MEKSKFMMIVIIVLLVVLLGTVVGVSFYILNLVRTTGEASGGNAPYADQPGKILNQNEVTNVSLGDSITTNLAPGQDGGGHVAKIGVSIRFDNTVKKESEALSATITESKDFARSIALSSIRNSTYEELSQKGGDSILSENILTKLQDEFRTTLIVDVYFTDWILN